MKPDYDTLKWSHDRWAQRYAESEFEKDELDARLLLQARTIALYQSRCAHLEQELDSARVQLAECEAELRGVDDVDSCPVGATSDVLADFDA